MKRKLLALLLLVTVSATVVACKGNETESAGTTTETDVSNETETTVPEPTQTDTENDEAVSSLDALGDVEVEKELFDVNLTIPAEYVGELSQEELEQRATDGGFQITVNDDGSATYTMTKSQHKELLAEMAEEIDSSLSDMVTDESYPNVTDVKANEDFTSFTVTTRSTALDMSESMSLLAFYMYGGMYGIFSGETPENIHVDFVNAESGEIIHSADSSDKGSQ